MLLLDFRLRTIKQTGLTVMVSKRLRPYPQFHPIVYRAGEAAKSMGLSTGPSRLARLIQAVRLIGRTSFGNLGLHHAVALHVTERTTGRINGNLMKIDRSQTRFLCIEVGEQTALQQRIV